MIKKGQECSCKKQKDSKPKGNAMIENVSIEKNQSSFLDQPQHSQTAQ